MFKAQPLFALKAVCALAVALITYTSASAQEIKIGFNSDMSATGSADFGVSALQGARQAAADLDAKGGVLGRKVVIVERDDMGSPPKAIQNTNELVDNVKVDAMLGGVNSGNMLAWLRIDEQKKIPTISPVATSTAITTRYASAPQNYIFRVSMADRDQLALLVAYAAKGSKNHKIALITDTTGYGQQGAKDATEILAMHGLKPVDAEMFGPTDTDMTSQLNKIKNSAADTLIVYALADSNAHVMRSLEKINYFPTVLGSWANLSPPYLRIAGPDLAKKMIFTASITEDSSQKSGALYQTLVKQNGSVPTYVMAAQAYDSVRILAAAMEQAKSVDGEKVQQALENLNSVDGVIKTYQKPFSHQNHEALSAKDFRLVRWDNGKIVTAVDDVSKSITPADIKE